MAVAFDAAERDRITTRLLDTAERLFAAQGLKKTSLEELVAPAGIAKSSFYAFFDSKESLYLQVMVRRAPLVARSLTAALARRPSADALAALMRTVAELLATDPFYRRLLAHPDELRAVSRRVDAGHLAQVTPHLMRPLIEYVDQAQRDGIMIADVAPEVVLGVIRTVGLVVLHREDFGPAYEQVLETTIRALAAGLTTPTKAGN